MDRGFIEIKKIVIFAIALLVVFVQTINLNGAEQEGKKFAGDQSDDRKRLCEEYSSMTFEQKNTALLFDVIDSVKS